MKSVRFFIAVVLCLSVAGLAGCGVSKNKYESLLAEKTFLEEKVVVLTAAKDALKKEYDNLLAEKMDISTKLETVTNEKAALKSEYDKILDEKIAVKAAYDTLITESKR